MIKGLLFDLDGVIVDTAKYHYLAWKSIADELQIEFTLADNELLKGVSRNRSFKIILELGNRTMSVEEQNEFCRRKNEIYLQYISNMTEEEILPGMKCFLQNAKEQGYKIALGSASKNAKTILSNVGLMNMFDAIIDGESVTEAKPNPEVFVKGAAAIHLQNEECLVFEDALAGIEAAHNAGMKAVGVGNVENLPIADMHVADFDKIVINDVIERLSL
ncbi:beta-phosphoglucomutase [Bacillus massiliigorillae]|uniref:beta-phosphoglucomutase n=1 Tax=Bacillus massiliigorillae TaxID=1243664 RepID=UPI0003A500BE|nr:beta-phosphoglucomutase [Bacillus massiliigorillae]